MGREKNVTPRVTERRSSGIRRRITPSHSNDVALAEIATKNNLVDFALIRPLLFSKQRLTSCRRRAHLEGRFFAPTEDGRRPISIDRGAWQPKKEEENQNLSPGSVEAAVSDIQRMICTIDYGETESEEPAFNQEEAVSKLFILQQMTRDANAEGRTASPNVQNISAVMTMLDQLASTKSRKQRQGAVIRRVEEAMAHLQRLQELTTTERNFVDGMNELRQTLLTELQLEKNDISQDDNTEIRYSRNIGRTIATGNPLVNLSRKLMHEQVERTLSTQDSRWHLKLQESTRQYKNLIPHRSPLNLTYKSKTGEIGIHKYVIGNPLVICKKPMWHKYVVHNLSGKKYSQSCIDGNVVVGLWEAFSLSSGECSLAWISFIGNTCALSLEYKNESTSHFEACQCPPKVLAGTPWGGYEVTYATPFVQYCNENTSGCLVSSYSSYGAKVELSPTVVECVKKWEGLHCDSVVAITWDGESKSVVVDWDKVCTM